MPIQKSHIASLGIAMLLAYSIPSFAQDLSLLVQDEGLAQAEEQPIENRYRIGIDCAPASAALRVHLRLPEDAGLLVNTVMPDSPADKAGIKRFDVIVEANGHNVESVVDLVRAVNEAKDSEMSLAVIHEGEKRFVNVTPQERDEDEIRRLRHGFADRLGRRAWPLGVGPAQEEFERAMEQASAEGRLDGNPVRVKITLECDMIDDALSIEDEIQY